MIELSLTDNSTSLTLPILAPPLSEAVVEGATDVVTLDMNMSTYFTYNKRQWSHTWSYLTEAEYNSVKGFYDRQFTLFKYPLLTITDAGTANTTNTPVRMTISPRRIIDNCGVVEEVTVTFRESKQMP